jgi:plastocyanin
MKGSFSVGTASATPPSTGGNVVTAKTRLVLTSGPGFSITLKTAAGKAVKTMKRGTYAVTVRDRSRIHNARVVAPGFNRATTVPFVGTQAWKVKLAKAGTLRFLCDPHASSGMKGSAKIVR